MPAEQHGHTGERAADVADGVTGIAKTEDVGFPLGVLLGIIYKLIRHGAPREVMDEDKPIIREIRPKPAMIRPEILLTHCSPPGSTFPAARNTEETIVGFYAQDTFHILSNLILSGGVRYDKNDLDFLDKLDSANTGERTFYRITPRAGITFLPTSQSSVYFSYSEGFRVPTYNELFGLGVGVFGFANPKLRPVRSHNYEVGGKVQVGRFGEVSLALFQSEVRDEIIAVCVDPSTCGSFSSPTNQNVDKTRRRGIEA